MLPLASGSLVLEALKFLNAQEEVERRVEFDSHLRELRDWWSKNEISKIVQSCRVIRDKVTAHTEIKYVIDRYVAVDITALDLKWSDVNNFTLELRSPVAAIGTLIRCAGFAWEMLDEQLANAAKNFWKIDQPVA